MDYKKSTSKLVDLIRSMKKGGGKPYFAFRDDYYTTRWSYEKVFRLSENFSLLLENFKIGKGDRVVIWGDNSLPLLIAFFGTINSGAVLVPLDGTFRKNTASRIIEKVQASLVVSTKDNRKYSGANPFIDLESLEERLALYPIKSTKNPIIYEDDLAEIVFTSGTTAERDCIHFRYDGRTKRCNDTA
jgi:acyl-coenzyme A synthetase/AMP-(fatty) acid ligase